MYFAAFHGFSPPPVSWSEDRFDQVDDSSACYCKYNKNLPGSIKPSKTTDWLQTSEGQDKISLL